MTERLSVDAIDALLPQTQCTRCGFPDCRSYAQAIAAEEADIDRCPPGGAVGIERLSALTGRPVIALNPDNGVEAPRRMAVIDETWCIGCTLCLKACPVDAIVGANKLMHTIDERACTGCDLCVPVCPVDCISMIDIGAPPSGWSAWTPAQAADSRERHAFRQTRLARADGERRERLQTRARAKLAQLRAQVGK